MILIADSGTTKTDWRLLSPDGSSTAISTEGVNPVFQSEEAIDKVFENALKPQLGNAKIEKIFFYGAGLSASNEATKAIEKSFEKSFPKVRLQLFTDKLGAARALCSNAAGIACIMGTGSNACFFDGEKIIDENVGGGFILGDEGGAVNLGKKLLSDFIRDLLPPEIKTELVRRFNLDYFSIIDSVYKRPMPNRFLASFSKFIYEFRQTPHIANLIESAFDAFISRNILRYDISKYPLNAVGSVAFFYSDFLENAALKRGVKIGKILKAPIEELAQFHKKDF